MDFVVTARLRHCVFFYGGNCMLSTLCVACEIFRHDISEWFNAGNSCRFADLLMQNNMS